MTQRGLITRRFRFRTFYFHANFLFQLICLKLHQEPNHLRDIFLLSTMHILAICASAHTHSDGISAVNIHKYCVNSLAHDRSFTRFVFHKTWMQALLQIPSYLASCQPSVGNLLPDSLSKTILSAIKHKVDFINQNYTAEHVHTPSHCFSENIIQNVACPLLTRLWIDLRFAL